MDEAALRYWKKFENETGEIPGTRAVGQWFQAGEREGLWGLLVITDKSLRFRHLPSDNWLNHLFTSRAREESTPESIEIVIPLAFIAEVGSPDRSLWSRIFGSQQASFIVDWSTAEGPRRESFSADSRRFVEALRSALQRRGD
ncbi:MAG TPA: hypothetical protein VMV44_01915 [Rectinemataceae bacterium]|nr:hypothetical protein [Rectinemataceae bacterium]